MFAFHFALTAIGHIQSNEGTMNLPPVSYKLESHPSDSNANGAIKTYLKNFERLAKSEKWDEIIAQGTAALEESKNTGKTQEEAKICAQLTSTTFYQGDYVQALVYANRCHELSKDFVDLSLYVRALYLESAVYRALAPKNMVEEAKQASYYRAVEIAEEALDVYSKERIENPNLLGKIYFNLGAAHADNPKGNLELAARCYLKALDCFGGVRANDDHIRTSIRLGKVYLLQKNYDLSQNTIDGIRDQVSNERLAMHTDYLEAQLKFAQNDFPNALKIAKNGLDRAKILGAQEDAKRLNSLIESIEKSTTISSQAFYKNQ